MVEVIKLNTKEELLTEITENIKNI